MPFQLPPRLSSALAGVLAAGIMLTVGGCSHVTPLGPDAGPASPPTHHLRSPLILQDVRIQLPMLGGGCPAGYAAISGPGMCYGPRTGAPVTITSAGVSPVSSFRPPPPAGQQAAPVLYGFWITVPASDVPAVAGIIPATPAAPGPPGPPTASVPTGVAATRQAAISVAGRTWVLVGFTPRFADREFEVFLPSRNQALQAQAMLAASG